MNGKLSRFLKKRRFGALFWVTFLLLTSAFLRLGIEIGPAVAREAETTAKPLSDKADVTGPDDHLTNSGSPHDTAELAALLKELQEREERIALQERQLEDQSKALEIANRAIEDRMTEMIQVEEALRSTLALADGASEADLEQLTTVYERMKPKESAALFETMDPAFAAGFLGRMKPEAAAGILAKISPEAAYRISVLLAGRNATVPKE